MSVSEELGVDLLGQRSGDSVVGVPIKKRKYHLVRTPSPPRISSLLPREPDIPQKDESIPELVTPALGIAGAAKGYSVADGLSFIDGNANLSNENSIGLNLHHSDVACTSTSEVELGCEGKLNPEDQLTFHQVAANPRLFSQEEPLGQPIVHEMSEGKPVMSNKSVFLRVPKNTELLSALKEPLGLPTEGQNIGGSCLKQENLYPFPQVVESCFDIHHGKLKDSALSEEQHNVQSSYSLSKSEVDCTQLHENRTLWDLNTTMDTWEGPFSDLSLNHAADRMNVLDSPQKFVLKPAVCSKDMVIRELKDSHVTSAKCLHVESNDSKQSFDFLSCFNQEPACSSTKLTLMKDGSDQSLSGKLMPPGNRKYVECKPVKSEQFEWGIQGNLSTLESRSQLVYLKTPKPEVSDRISKEGIPTVGTDGLKSVNRIKSESIGESSQVGLKAGEGISLLPETHKLTPECPISQEVDQGVKETVVKGLYLVPESVVTNTTESVVAKDMLDASQMAYLEVAYPKCSPSVSVGVTPVVSGTAESDDDERIYIPADVHEDDHYDSDTELNSSPNVDTVVRQANDNDNDDDFEDGEVRETLVHDTYVEGIHEDSEMGHVSCGDLDNKEADGSGDPGGGVMQSSHVECTDGKTENPGEAVSAPCTGEHDSDHCNEKKEPSRSTVPSLKKSSASAVSTAGSGKKRSIKVIQRRRSCKGQKEHGLKDLGTTSDQAVSASASHETIKDDDKDKTVSKQDSVKDSTDLGRVSHLNLPKTDSSVRGDEANRINCSRIINLAQGSNGQSMGRTRSMQGAPMVLRTDSRRFPHSSLRVEELHPRGSRDESGMDGVRKFERNRNIDRLAGNPGSDFIHMKRRVDNSSDTHQCDREFVSRGCSSMTGARFTRPKNIAAVATAELECNGFVIAPDGSVVKSGKAWRKNAHDELESLRYPPFRRRSPGGREGHMPLGVRMVHRPPRVISPERCINRVGPDVAIIRHEEKFIRDLPDDMVDPLLSRSRSQYQRVHGPFVRRERSFSPVQRRGSVRVPRICSKSPPRSRSRSPCSWPPPRRSPDQFDGHPELLMRRSPPVFRGERMRSPHQHPCFADALMLGRHGSPPHMPQLSDEMRKMGPLREHDHSRPFILNRSPSGRILHRNNRRFDTIDSREMVEGDGHFGPLPSGRFDELVVDDGVNERRRCRERGGPLRSFRPHDMAVDVERLRYQEDGSRLYRFCPGADAEFQERGNPRDFEVRVNNRLGNPRRPRSIEEQDDVDRFRGQEWDEVRFNDAVRLKRGRF